MIDEDIRPIIEAELQPEEELLWAEKVDLRPFIRRNFRSNLYSILLMNAAFAILYFTQFGDFSLKTTVILAVSANCGGLAILYSAIKSMPSKHTQTAHFLTSQRVATIAWLGNNFRSISHAKLATLTAVQFNKLNQHYEILFLFNQEPSGQHENFEIVTQREISQFESIIRPLITANQ